MNEQKMARTAPKLKTKKNNVAGLEQQIKGTLTSRIEKRGSSEPYYYGFFKLNDQKQEIPVIFKGNKPNLIKGNQLELTGHWANSSNSRPSFTCLSYQIKPDYQAVQEVYLG